jgi:hypothetical protein
MVARAATCAVLGALLLGGTSCGSTLEPIGTAPECPDQPLRGPLAWADEPRVQLIDDFESGVFESGNSQLERIDGRTGAWILGRDLRDLSAGSITAETSNRCVANGGHSGHFAASGFANWGNNWSAVFNAVSSAGTAVPFNAQAYGGISFWAAFDGNNPGDFEVPVGVTTMDNAWNGGICSVCMDYYGTKVALTHAWRRFVIRFSDLGQAGTGSPIVPMRKDQMVSFIIWPKQQFDLWIDDVRFEL